MEINQTEEKKEDEFSKPESLPETDPVKKNKRKYDFYFELALFFILGILIGIVIKTEAMKKITIGFDDYKMKIQRQDYDINKIQEKLTAAQKEEEAQAEQQSAKDAENEKTNIAPTQ